MKKLIPFFVLCLLLCGCGERELSPEELQSQYEKIATAEMEAEVTLNASQGSTAFVLECSYCAEGKSRCRILEPEELSGITASVEGEDLTVTYGDMILPAGTLEGLCPANALMRLLQTLGCGYVSRWGSETVEDVALYSLTLDDTLSSGEVCSCTAYLDRESLIPRFAEFADAQGQKIISIRMLSFSCSLKEE